MSLEQVKARLGDAVGATPSHLLTEVDPDDLRALLSHVERVEEMARQALPLLGIASSWGHCSASGGRRVAGFFYKPVDVVTGSVLPAHCLSSMRELVAALTSTREGVSTGGEEE